MAEKEQYKPPWLVEREKYREGWKLVRKIDAYFMELISLQWQGDNVFHTGKRVDMTVPGPVIDLAKGIACWNTPVKIFILGGGKCRVTVTNDLDWKIEKILNVYNSQNGRNSPEWERRCLYLGYDVICLKGGPNHIANMEEAQKFGYFLWYLDNNFKWDMPVS
jgi:DNA-binding XRE family transcriptional regulator